jgi:hypothetical protein
MKNSNQKRPTPLQVAVTSLLVIIVAAILWKRVSELIAPKPFNKASYDADSSTYLSTFEPGRIFQTAPPAPGTPELKPVGNTFAVGTQSDSIKLSVKTVPGYPATFVTQDGGFFENKLNGITVKADADGVATATYVAGPGTIGNVNILSGSPLSSGQVRFRVIIQGSGVVAPAPNSANTKQK